MRVYGQPDCGPCRAVTRKLDKEAVSYDYVDVTEDAAARRRLQERGMTRTPVVETDTDMFSGTDVTKLNNAIEAARIESSAQPSPTYTTAPELR